MTPKEKAKELFFKFRPVIAGKQFLTGFVLMSEAKELTKQCAMIAVDEIIDSINWHPLEYPNKEIIFWNEVIEEILKL